MTLWLDSNNHDKPWYTGTKSEVIDKQLLVAIQPPVELTRVPRSVKERKYWTEYSMLYQCFVAFFPRNTGTIFPSCFWNLYSASGKDTNG